MRKKKIILTLETLLLWLALLFGKYLLKTHRHTHRLGKVTIVMSQRALVPHSQLSQVGGHTPSQDLAPPSETLMGIGISSSSLSRLSNSQTAPLYPCPPYLPRTTPPFSSPPEPEFILSLPTAAQRPTANPKVATLCFQSKWVRRSEGGGRPGRDEALCLMSMCFLRYR